MQRFRLREQSHFILKLLDQFLTRLVVPLFECTCIALWCNIWEKAPPLFKGPRSIDEAIFWIDDLLTAVGPSKDHMRVQTTDEADTVFVLVEKNGDDLGGKVSLLGK